MAATPFATCGPWYAQRLGWHIFPLRPMTKIPYGGCDRCRRPTEKRPNPNHVEHDWRDCPCLATPGALCHGLCAATNDPAVIDQWAEQHPDANLAVHVGRSNMLVVDLDDHKDVGEPPEQPLPGIDAPQELANQVKTGMDTFGLLCAVRAQDWPGTLTQETTSGGAQMFFGVKDGSRFKPSAGKLGWQIDVKAGDSYAVLPGSVTEKGEYKLVQRRDPAPVPAWLADDLTRTGHVRQAIVPPQRDPNWRPPRLAGGRAYVEAAVAAELTAVAHSIPGQRNDQLIRSSFNLGQFVGPGLLDRGRVHAELAAAAAQAEQSPNLAKINDTIRRGLDAGSRSPRTIPEGGRV